MLTHEQIKQAARLMQQVGELRPGFLKDDTSALEGPEPRAGGTRGARPAKLGKTSRKTGKTLKVRLVFHEDSETGDVQIVEG